MHTVYLGIIVVLVLLVVVLLARAVKARALLADMQKTLGLNRNLTAGRPRSSPLREMSGIELISPRTFEEYEKEFRAILKSSIDSEDIGTKGSSVANDCWTHLVRPGLRSDNSKYSIALMEIARSFQASKYANETKSILIGNDGVDCADLALAVEFLRCAHLRSKSDKLPEASVRSSMFTASALQCVARQVDWLRQHCPTLINADRVGIRLVGEFGHVLERLAAAENSDEKSVTLDSLTQYTTALFEFATVVGWLIAGGNDNVGAIADLRAIGRHFGIAFQTADDVGILRLMGPGSAPSSVSEWLGIDAAKRECAQNLAACRLLLEKRKIWTAFWNEWFNKLSSIVCDEPIDQAIQVAKKPDGSWTSLNDAIRTLETSTDQKSPRSPSTVDSTSDAQQASPQLAEPPLTPSSASPEQC